MEADTDRKVGWRAGSHLHRQFNVGSGDGISPLPISPGQRLTDAVKVVGDLPFGGTDCALPMLYALERKLDVDVFVVLTDNETWAGSVHPSRRLASTGRRQASRRSLPLSA